MRTTVLALTLLAPLSGAVAALTFAACSGDPTAGAGPDASAPPPSPPAPDGSRADAPSGGDAGTEAAGPSLCELTKQLTLACGGTLTCGDAGFDTWCAQNDALVNSAQFRAGQRQCLVAPANCDSNVRGDCQYRTYASQARTAAQQKVVDDYCATCFPSDVTGCKQRSVTYDVDAGPGAVPDIFIAAWELSDPLTSDIDTKCTGSALDGGADAGCVRAFADCAGGLYIDRLPNCP